MKIFLSFLQSEENYPIPSYSFWQYYVKNGIEEAGYEWTECPHADWALGLVPKSKEEQEQWMQDTWAKTVNYLKKNPADLFLSYLYPGQVDMASIKEIQNLGIPCVNFFCDNVRDFDKIPVEFGAFDLNWVPEHKARLLYRKAGYQYINVPMPMWVDPKYRILRDERNHQVTFIGSKDIQRVLLFEDVISQSPEIQLSIYGNGWKKNQIAAAPFIPPSGLLQKINFNLGFIQDQGITPFLRKIKHRKMSYEVSAALSKKIHRSPSFEYYNDLTAQSLITLGVNRYESLRFSRSKPNSYSKLRDIEAPMLGACYLTEYTDGIKELYDIGNEIAVYKDANEMIEQINELRADKVKRKKLKMNGQKKALAEHSIPRSINKIIQRLMR